MKIPRLLIISLVFILITTPARVLAQTAYSFQMPQLIVNVFWNGNGTTSIDYLFNFKNEPTGHIIDTIDVGIPNRYFDISSIRADVNGSPVSDISTSGFQGKGSGVAIGLGPSSILPGESGTVHVFIGTVNRMMYPSTTDTKYASVNFIPHYYDSSTVHSATDLSVIFHLPAGVQPDEGRWYASPAGWEYKPDTALDEQGRVMYTWRSANALGYWRYLFGAGFPRKYVPASAIVRETIFDKLGKFYQTLIIWVVKFNNENEYCLLKGVWTVILAYIISRKYQARYKRKMQYLPPKIAIEGHGIKRGLTSIEAAILMQEPMDKIITMILFAVIKKNAARVVKREPLEIQSIQPTPEGLQSYEIEFLTAFVHTPQPEDMQGLAPYDSAKFKPSAYPEIEHRKALQDMVVNLVKGVSEKMRGFSRNETVSYYRYIIEEAWQQVEAAGTPEVKSAKYDEVMEWTILDRVYDERTRRTFSSGPVFVPNWWPRYDPAFGLATISPSGTPISLPTSVGGGPVSLPHLPGSDFAASLVKGVQNFSSNAVGSVSDFTFSVTNKTNPPPPPNTYDSSDRGSRGNLFGGGGGGHHCACACACAGCACACAGGGR